jgi:hypothetical protein
VGQWQAKIKRDFRSIFAFDVDRSAALPAL